MKRISSNLFLVIALAILIYCIYIVIQSGRTGEEVFILGHKPYIIQTGSMEPELRVNSLVVARRNGFERVRVGDIIVFKAPGFDVNVCHRVIAIEDNEFITQGDNNSYPDNIRITEENFVGTIVFNSNITSYIISAFQHDTVFWTSMIISSILIIAAIQILISNNYKISSRQVP